MDPRYNETTRLIGYCPANLRHEVLQLTVIFICGINQLSPGAYFLRHDLFPCIVKVKRPFLHMET